MNPNDFCGESPVKLFDMSIENLDERREKAIPFDTINKCAGFLGYNQRSLFTSLKNKCYVYHKTNGKKYAIRRSSIKQVL